MFTVYSVSVRKSRGFLYLPNHRPVQSDHVAESRLELPLQFRLGRLSRGVVDRMRRNPRSERIVGLGDLEDIAGGEGRSVHRGCHGVKILERLKNVKFFLPHLQGF